MPLRGSLGGGFQLAPSQKSSAAKSSMRSLSHAAVRLKRAIKKIVACLPPEARSFRKSWAPVGGSWSSSRWMWPKAAICNLVTARRSRAQTSSL